MKKATLQQLLLMSVLTPLLTQALNQTETIQTISSQPSQSNPSSITGKTLGLVLMILSPLLGILIVSLAYLSRKKTIPRITPDDQEDPSHSTPFDHHPQQNLYTPDIHFQHRFFHMSVITTVKRRHVEILSALIESGADVNQPDKHGMTALMYAARANNLACINVLINANADTHKTDKAGNSALSYALKHQPQDDQCYLLLRLAQILKITTSGLSASETVLDNESIQERCLTELANLCQNAKNREIELIQTMHDIANEKQWPWVSEQGRLLLETALLRLFPNENNPFYTISFASKLSS